MGKVKKTKIANTILENERVEKVDDLTSFKAPLYIAWEISHLCNANCIHCYSDSSPLAKTDEDLTTEMCIEIIDQLADAGLMVLALSGGEPILRNDWDILAKHALDRGLVLNIGTNGSSINKKTADIIKKLGINSVTVSLDSHLPVVHERIRQKKGLFQETLNAISLLVERGIRVVVGFTPTKLNWRDGNEVIKLAKSLKANAVNLSNYVPAGRGTINIDLNEVEYKELLENWVDYREQYKDEIDIIWHDCRVALLVPEHDKRDYLGCGAGRFVARILPNGDVTPCFFLPESIGSLKDNSFTDIWHNSELLKLFRERDNYTEGNCKECEHLLICGGCRSVAYAYGDKNPLAGDPHCWIIPESDDKFQKLIAGSGLPF